MAVIEGALNGVEREMTVNQRGLVDTCFEEGQYETGIAILDGLRSSSLKPFPAHIRQLLYLALYPPYTPAQEIEDVRNGLGLSVPSSPSKLGGRHHKSALIPTLAASTAAQDLLMAFAEANTPNSLFRALPGYVPPGPVSGMASNSIRGTLDGSNEDEDSPVARQSVKIKEAKSCWEILRERFMQPQIDVSATPRARTRNRRRHFDDDDITTAPPEHLRVIAPHSWPVLNWMITVLEKDEDRTACAGQARYSPLLLAQIPPSRNAGGRWEVGTVLDIVLHCFEQTEEKYMSLGIRLTALLIKLADSDDFNAHMCMAAACSRFDSLESEKLMYILSHLPRKPLSILEFKLFLCRGLLKDPSSDINSSSGTRPRPTVRALPRVRTRRLDPAAESSTPGVAADRDAVETGPSATTTALRKIPATTPSDVLRLLANANASPSDMLLNLRVKNELVRTFIALQLSDTGEQHRDSGWRHLIESGQLRQSIEQSFATHSRSQNLIAEVDDLKSSLLSFIETATYPVGS